MWFSAVCYPNLDQRVDQEISMNDKSLSVEQDTLGESSQTVNVLPMHCAGKPSWLGTLNWQTAES